MYKQFQQLRRDLEANGFFVEYGYTVKKQSYVLGLFCSDEFAVEMNYGREDVVHLSFALDLLDF